MMRLEGREMVAAPQQLECDICMSGIKVDRGYTAPKQNRSGFDTNKCHFGEGRKVREIDALIDTRGAQR